MFTCVRKACILMFLIYKRQFLETIKHPFVYLYTRMHARTHAHTHTPGIHEPLAQTPAYVDLVILYKYDIFLVFIAICCSFSIPTNHFSVRGFITNDIVICLLLCLNTEILTCVFVWGEYRCTCVCVCLCLCGGVSACVCVCVCVGESPCIC